MKAKKALEITNYVKRLRNKKNIPQEIVSYIYYQIEREAWGGFHVEKTFYFNDIKEINCSFDKYEKDVLKILKKDGYHVEKKDTGEGFLGRGWSINWNVDYFKKSKKK